MEEIKSQKLEAFELLDRINKEKWTASHDGGWRCGILTINISECINGVLKDSRRLPLTAIAEMAFRRSIHYFGERILWSIPSPNTISSNSPPRLLQDVTVDMESILMLSKLRTENVLAASGLNLVFLAVTLKSYALHT
ncbi:UNVERIFIED_CONTAM: hypothetical protein Sindi_0144400 [Sesamum indicum]